MRLPSPVLFLAFLCFHLRSAFTKRFVQLPEPIDADLVVLILSQPSSFHEEKAFRLKADIIQQSNLLGQAQIPTVYVSHMSFPDHRGAWAVWPLFNSLLSKRNEDRPFWLFICDGEREIRLGLLLEALDGLDASTPLLLGAALRDSTPSVVHHYASTEDALAYPSVRRGMVVSGALVSLLAEKAVRKSDFAIDAMHELAVRCAAVGVSMQPLQELCLNDSPHRDQCVTYLNDAALGLCEGGAVEQDEVYFAVKTFHGNHKTRVAVVKRTWGKDAKHLDFYSDVDDQTVPTVDLGIANTKSGHCAKTYAILRRFLEEDRLSKYNWLVVADDDTILSVNRLLLLLGCLDNSQPLILGDRYGYGFSSDGAQGYDYATGGAGMVFSRPAVQRIIANGRGCGSDDAPDDMILGMDALITGVPVIHSAAFHQARPVDYPEELLLETPSISFHRYRDVDPDAIYREITADTTTQHSTHEDL